MPRPINVSREQIFELYAKGINMAEIGRRLGCTRGTVDYAVRIGYKPERKSICPICGQEYAYVGGKIKKTCPSEYCMREYRRQQSKKYNQQCAPLGKIREYSSTASMMILRDLEKGWSAQQIAAEYGRDVTDVQQHIEKILQDGTAEKIKKRLAAYQESNTLKRRSGLL